MPQKPTICVRPPTIFVSAIKMMGEYGFSWLRIVSRAKLLST